MKAFNSRMINTLFLSGFFVVLVASFVRYYYLKEFPVHIEVSCDPASELCFYRDCETEECPPNGFSNYRQFELSGSVFATCSEVDGCEGVCKSGNGDCIETVCGDGEEDSCAEITEDEFVENEETEVEELSE